MSLREKLEAALRSAGADEDYLNRWFNIILESCREILSSPGFLGLELGLYFVEEEDFYATFWKRIVYGIRGKLPTKIEPVTNFVVLVDSAILEFGYSDMHWQYGIGSGFFIQRSIVWDVFYTEDEENVGLNTSQIFDREVLPDEVHLLTLTTRDLTRKEYEEAKQQIFEFLVDEKSSEDMEWWNSLPVPELAD